MNNRIQRTLAFFLVFLLLLCATGPGSAKDLQGFNQEKNQLIGYMLEKELPAIHFSHKKMDASLSMAVFNLYLKQLDYQKRFLLNGDVTALRAFAPHITDTLETGTNTLPIVGFDIMNTRIDQVEKMVDQIMAAGFDVKKEEAYETDPKKIDYVDLNGLQDRWRKVIKAQVIYQYLDLVEKQEKAAEKLPDDELWKQAKEKVAKVNKDLFRRLHQVTLQDYYDLFFNAMAMAFDPHTNYLPPSQKEEFDIQMRGNLEGIGGSLREENGFIKVVNIIPGSPAAKQGMLQIGDIILEVAEKGADPVDITNMRLNDAVRIIRGPKGTEVRLTVKKPDGTKEVIPIIRNVVQIEDTFVKDTVMDAPDGGKIGYILIPSFYRDFKSAKDGDTARNATADTRKAIAALNKTNLEGLILDLRNDGGGSLVDAVDIAGLFIKSGPIVQVKESNGTIRVLNDDDKNIEYSGPLVVLVNQFSASASEIVAAALQDYKRAIIVGGEPTHGKGTVQAVINLNKNLLPPQSKEIGDVGALTVTIEKFYRVTGQSTQYKGVAPDIVLPSLFQQVKSGEKYLDYSLPWDRIKPVKYTPFSSGKLMDLDMLRKRSMQRVQRDPGLQVIAVEAAKADERNKQTSISLRLTDMRQKVEEAREERKRFSALFRNYRTGVDGDEQPGVGEEVKPTDWQEQIKQDPFIGEAKKIIVDMRK